MSTISPCSARRHVVHVLALAAGVLAGRSARAEDIDAPVIVHYPCATYQRNSTFQVQTRFKDASELWEPRVHFRFGGDSAWTIEQLVVVPKSESVYAWSTDTTGESEPLEYVLEVFDIQGNGPALYGERSAPVVVAPSDETSTCNQLEPPTEEIVAFSPILPEPRRSGAEPRVTLQRRQKQRSESPVRISLRVEPGVGIMLGKPQLDVYDLVGGGGNLLAGIRLAQSSPLFWLRVELAGGYVTFPAKGSNRGGSAYVFGGGARLDPFRDDGAFLAAPHLAVHGALARTGRLTRFAFDASAGLDFGFGSLRMGPFVRYTEIFDRGSKAVSQGDALILVIGLGVGISDIEGAFAKPEPEPPPPPALALVSAPIPIDQDGDGLPDRSDACPADAEDRDGFEDHDGCPELDNDSDGRPDAEDQCPSQAEDGDGFQDDDGCPDQDNDGDGVPDPTDGCPNEAETFNSVDDQDGCPDLDRARAYINIEKKIIAIKDRVYFKTGSARILKKSNAVLDDVVRILQDFPDIRLLRIDGHTDDRGSDAYNQRLSARRAASVMSYLIRHGVEKERLGAKGYGKSKPLMASRTRMARKVNRRVEFLIIDRLETTEAQ